MVAPFLMTRDITDNKKEQKESVMTITESGVEFFATTQKMGQIFGDYYKIFKAQVDTIDAHKQGGLFCLSFSAHGRRRTL